MILHVWRKKREIKWSVHFFWTLSESTTEFFVLQQSFYWTRRFDPETRTYTRRRPEFPGRNVVFNKTIAGRRRTLLLNVKPARICENLIVRVPACMFSIVSLSVLYPLQLLPYGSNKPRDCACQLQSGVSALQSGVDPWFLEVLVEKHSDVGEARLVELCRCSGWLARRSWIDLRVLTIRRAVSRDVGSVLQHVVVMAMISAITWGEEKRNVLQSTPVADWTFHERSNSPLIILQHFFVVYFFVHHVEDWRGVAPQFFNTAEVFVKTMIHWPMKWESWTTLLISPSL